MNRRYIPPPPVLEYTFQDMFFTVCLTVLIVSFLFCMFMLWWTRTWNPMVVRYFGENLTPKNGRRIFGRCGEAIIDGCWTHWTESIWMTNPHGYYLYVAMTEFSSPVLKIIAKDEARSFIEKYADDLLKPKLLREWFSSKGERGEWLCAAKEKK